ncbi:MAG: PQQ-dependent sugar dehydrogenase [Nitrososphaerales archaeon]
MKKRVAYLTTLIMTVLITSIAVTLGFIFGHFATIQYVSAQPMIVNDPTLKVESVVSGLSSPTSMAFLNGNNILVLEKDGNVRLVSNGELQQQPILHVPVDVKSERGLLGIAIMNTTGNNNNKEVFLYYTESQGEDIRNRVYRYDWNGQTLVDPKLFLDLPGLPGPNHDGGKLVIGKDGYLYAIIGELRHNDKLQNIKDGPDPDDTGVIFRVSPLNGSPAKDNPFASNEIAAMHKYYAYGIRNSFGIAIDPVTGNLWETENGENTYDEINLVKPGFNGGWKVIMGPLSRSDGITANELVNFPGSHYADPVFSWLNPVAVTAIEFLKSSKLGANYDNNIFVGDYNNGNLYFFKVNKDRTGIEFNTNQKSAGLSDLVADNKTELDAVKFGMGFNSITDIKTGPDGMLYVLAFDDGTIYRISRAS